VCAKPFFGKEEKSRFSQRAAYVSVTLVNKVTCSQKSPEDARHRRRLLRFCFFRFCNKLHCLNVLSSENQVSGGGMNCLNVSSFALPQHDEMMPQWFVAVFQNAMN
jgi:hypothetical protein